MEKRTLYEELISWGRSLEQAPELLIAVRIVKHSKADSLFKLIRKKRTSYSSRELGRIADADAMRN